MISSDILTLTKGVRGKLVKKCLLDASVSVTYLLQAACFIRIIENLRNGIPLRSIYPLAGSLLALFILRGVCFAVAEWYGKKMIGAVKNTVRERCYRKLFALGQGFLTGERTGALESTIVAGIDRLDWYITQYLPQIGVCCIVSFGIIAYIFVHSITIGLIVLCTAAISLGAPVFYGYLMVRRSGRTWYEYLALTAELLDSLQGMDTLKAYHIGQRQGDKLKRMMADLKIRTMKNVKCNIEHIGIRIFFSNIGKYFSLLLAAYLAVQGTISLRIPIIFLYIIAEVFRPVIKLAILYHSAFEGITTSRTIAEFLREPLLVNDMGTTALRNPPKVITFSNITFSYKGKNAEQPVPIFSDFNLSLRQGEHLALVGKSGAGKTTLFNLLLRFYDPDSGALYFDSTDIRTLPLADVRSLISCVSQDTYLFHGTIRENLLLARSTASDEELIQAAQQANIHRFIETLPLGYDSLVGERGINFSGGQRQRLSIARALLKNAPIILLDEATSGIDEGNEHEIQESLAVLLRGKTTITIAHRLSTIEAADRILVLQNGRIVEQGAHRDLLEKRGSYYTFIEAQQPANGRH